MTTTLLPPLQMHADNTIHFRDPFVSQDTYQRSWHSYPPNAYADFVRALTPPPEMNGPTYTSKPGYYQQENGGHFGDYMPAQQSYRAPVAPYLPPEISSTDFGRNGVATQPNSRTMSPVFYARQTTVDDSQLQNNHRRREPQASAIAPSFQIPKTVNDSGGSLSELAAQVSAIQHLIVRLCELLLTCQDHMLVLVRRIRNSPTSRGFTDLSSSTKTTGFGCQTINWV